MSAIAVVEAGWGTTIQDHGRPRYADLGVPRAGAVDREAHDRANRLVGNPPGAAAFETLGGLIVEALTPIIVGTSGNGARRTLEPGDRVTVTPADGTLWAYLSVRGGLAVTPVLGSRSTDTLSGIGPPPVAVDDRFAVLPDPGTPMPTELAPRRPASNTVRLWEGPRVDWFDGGLSLLTRRAWTVGEDVSRIGARLSAGEFPTTPSAPTGVMPSEGLIEGAIQVTPSGEPIVMLANHPTTGGYPVIAVVDPDDQSIVANARPGSVLRFRRV